jgi:hypothetical protein
VRVSVQALGPVLETEQALAGLELEREPGLAQEVQARAMASVLSLVVAWAMVPVEAARAQEPEALPGSAERVRGTVLAWGLRLSRWELAPLPLPLHKLR